MSHKETVTCAPSPKAVAHLKALGLDVPKKLSTGGSVPDPDVLDVGDVIESESYQKDARRGTHLRAQAKLRKAHEVKIGVVTATVGGEEIDPDEIDVV